MADTELVDLTEDTSPSQTDIFYSIKDPAGTPLDRKVSFENAASAMSSYGDMYENNDGGTVIAITTAGTYYGWVSASEGTVAGAGAVTFLSHATADRLVVGANGGGTYMVNVSMSFTGTANATITAQIFLNDAAEDAAQMQRKISTGGDVGASSMNVMLTLAADDYIDLRFTSDGNGDSVGAKYINVSIART